MNKMRIHHLALQIHHRIRELLGFHKAARVQLASHRENSADTGAACFICGVFFTHNSSSTMSLCVFEIPLITSCRSVAYA